MNFTLQREQLLKPLQAVMGVVERRQTLPILANVLLKVDNQLAITATDLEVELVAKVDLTEPAETFGEITVPGRKLVDICRSLPEQSQIQLYRDKDKVIISSGRSRFSLSTLSASDYPKIENIDPILEFPIEQKNLKFLTQRTYFAMAQQDVRYYLNGMLLEINEGLIRSVATDGHRLALNKVMAPLINNNCAQVIIPRKGVIELMRLLEESETEINVAVSQNHIGITSPHFTFTSKLIDGRYPDYERVLPRGGDKTIILDRESFKQSLTRTAILSNEKFRGIRLQLRKGLIRVLANNPEQEEAEEELQIDYQNEDLDIGFNVDYLKSIVDAIDDSDTITLTFSDSHSSVLIEGSTGDGNSLYVVMPMRL